MTSLMESLKKLQKKPLAWKDPVPGHPLMTRGEPIIGNNPKGPGIVPRFPLIPRKKKLAIA